MFNKDIYSVTILFSMLTDKFVLLHNYANNNLFVNILLKRTVTLIITIGEITQNACDISRNIN